MRISGIVLPALGISLHFASAFAADPSGLPHALDAGWQGTETCELLFEDDSVIVGRCDFPPGVGHEKHYHNPHFGYVLQGSTLRIIDESGEQVLETTTGDNWSTDQVTVHEALNVGDVTTSYLLVEPKAPVAANPND
jgi:quercetin dioxygenase-like cupin family protein